MKQSTKKKISVDDAKPEDWNNTRWLQQEKGEDLVNSPIHYNKGV
jgi:hypothetical protein